MTPEELAAEIARLKALNEELATKNGQDQVRLREVEAALQERENAEKSDLEKLQSELAKANAEVAKLKPLEETVNAYQRDLVIQLEEDLKNVTDVVRTTFTETCNTLGIDYKQDPKKAVGLLSSLKKASTIKGEGVPPSRKYTGDSKPNEGADDKVKTPPAGSLFSNVSLEDALKSFRK